MVQLKYFGDDRDYFKYDLISFLLSKKIFSSYCFIPMLTEHRIDREGDIIPKSTPCKSVELLNYIKSHKKPDLNHWERWLNQFVSDYKTIAPVNTTYFTDQNRTKYWDKYEDIISSDNALIFFDPDTGLQAGRKSYIKKTDKEKYILNIDLPCLLEMLSDSSMYIIYQHLQRNRHRHSDDIKRKIRALENSITKLYAVIYYENDLAFVFICKNSTMLSMTKQTLAEYDSRSTINHRGFHGGR